MGASPIPPIVPDPGQEQNIGAIPTGPPPGPPTAPAQMPAYRPPAPMPSPMDILNQAHMGDPSLIPTVPPAPPPMPSYFGSPLFQTINAIGKHQEHAEKLRNAGMMTSAIREMFARENDYQGVVKIRIPRPQAPGGSGLGTPFGSPLAGEEGLGDYFTTIEPWYRGETQEQARARGVARAHKQTADELKYSGGMVVGGLAWPGPIVDAVDMAGKSVGLNPGWRDLINRVEQNNPTAAASGMFISLGASFAPISAVSGLGHLAGKAWTFTGANLARGANIPFGGVAAPAVGMSRLSTWMAEHIQRVGKYITGSQLRRVDPAVLSAAAADMTELNIATTKAGYLIASRMGVQSAKAPTSFLTLAEELRRVGYEPALKWQRLAQGVSAAGTFGTAVGTGSAMGTWLRTPNETGRPASLGAIAASGGRGFIEGTAIAGGSMLIGAGARRLLPLLERGAGKTADYMRRVVGKTPPEAPTAFLGDGLPPSPFPRGGPGASHYQTTWEPPYTLEANPNVPGGKQVVPITQNQNPGLAAAWDELVRLAQNGNQDAIRLVKMFQGRAIGQGEVVTIVNGPSMAIEAEKTRAFNAAREAKLRQEKGAQLAKDLGLDSSSTPSRTVVTPEGRVLVEADRTKTLTLDTLTKSQPTHVGTLEFKTELPGYAPTPIAVIDGRLVAIDQVFNKPLPDGSTIPISTEPIDVQHSVSELSIHPSSNPTIVTPPESPIALQLTPEGTLEIDGPETARRQAGWQGQLAQDLTGASVRDPLDLEPPPFPRSLALNADEHSEFEVEQIQSTYERREAQKIIESKYKEPPPAPSWNPAWPEETELVPVSTLANYRLAKAKPPREMVESLQQEGVNSPYFDMPVIIEVSPEGNVAVLGNGNSRLAAAEEVGLPALPAIVRSVLSSRIQQPRPGFSTSPPPFLPSRVTMDTTYRPSEFGFEATQIEGGGSTLPAEGAAGDNTGNYLMPGSLAASYGGRKVSTDIDVRPVKQTLAAGAYGGPAVAITGALQNSLDAIPDGIPPDQLPLIITGVIPVKPNSADPFKLIADHDLNYLGGAGAFFGDDEPAKEGTATTVIDHGTGMPLKLFTEQFMAVGETTEKHEKRGARGGKGFESLGIATAQDVIRVLNVPTSDPEFDFPVVHALESTAEEQFAEQGQSTITAGTWKLIPKEVTAPAFHETIRGFVQGQRNKHFELPFDFEPVGETIGAPPAWVELYLGSLMQPNLTEVEGKRVYREPFKPGELPHGVIVSTFGYKTTQDITYDISTKVSGRILPTSLFIGKGQPLIGFYSPYKTIHPQTQELNLTTVTEDNTDILGPKAPVSIFAGPPKKEVDMLDIYYLNNGYAQRVGVDFFNPPLEDTPDKIYVDIKFSFSNYPPEEQGQARLDDPWNVQRTDLNPGPLAAISQEIQAIIKKGKRGQKDKLYAAYKDAIDKSVAIFGQPRRMIHSERHVLPDNATELINTTLAPFFDAMVMADTLIRGFTAEPGVAFGKPVANRAIGIAMTARDWLGLANIELPDELKSKTTIPIENIWTLNIPSLIKKLHTNTSFGIKHYHPTIDNILAKYPYTNVPNGNQYQALSTVVDQLVTVSIHEITHLDAGKYAGHEAAFYHRLMQIYGSLVETGGLKEVVFAFTKALEPLLITDATRTLDTPEEVMEAGSSRLLDLVDFKSWQETKYDWTREVVGVQLADPNQPPGAPGSGRSDQEARQSGLPGGKQQAGQPALSGSPATRGGGKSARKRAKAAATLEPIDSLGRPDIDPSIFADYPDALKLAHLKALYKDSSESAQFARFDNLDPDKLKDGKPAFIGSWRPNPAQLAELTAAYKEWEDYWVDEKGVSQRPFAQKFLQGKGGTLPTMTPKQKQLMMNQVAILGPLLQSISDKDYDYVLNQVFNVELPDPLRSAWLRQLNREGASNPPPNASPDDWGRTIVQLNEIVRKANDIPANRTAELLKQLQLDKDVKFGRMRNFILNNLDELDRKIITGRTLLNIFGRPEATLGGIKNINDAADIDMYRSVFFILENGHARTNAEFEEKLLKLNTIFTLLGSHPELEANLERYFEFGMIDNTPIKGKLGIVGRTQEFYPLDLAKQLESFFKDYFDGGNGRLEKASIAKLNANIATLALYIEQQRQVILADLEICKTFAEKIRGSSAGAPYAKQISLLSQMSFAQFAEACREADSRRYDRTEASIINTLTPILRKQRTRDQVVRWTATVAGAWRTINKHRSRREDIRSGYLSNINPLKAMREVLQDEYRTHHTLTHQQKLAQFFSPEELESVVRTGTVGSFAGDLASFLAESARMIHLQPALAQVRNRVDLIVQTGKSKKDVSDIPIAEGMWQRLPTGQKVLLYFLFNIMEEQDMDPVAERAFLQVMAHAASGKTTFASNIQSLISKQTGAQRSKSNPLAARVATPSAANELVMPLFAYFYSIMLSSLRSAVINGLDVMNLAYVMWEQSNPLLFAVGLPGALKHGTLDTLKTAGVYLEKHATGRIHELPESRRVGAAQMASDLAEIMAFSVDPVSGRQRNFLGKLIQVTAAGVLSAVKGADLWARSITYYAVKRYALRTGVDDEIAIAMARERQAWTHTMSGLMTTSIWTRGLTTKLFRPLLTYMAAKAEDTADMAATGVWGPATRATLPEKWTGKSWLRPGLDEEREAGGPIYPPPAGGDGGKKPPGPPSPPIGPGGLDPEEAEWWNNLNKAPLPVGWGYTPSRKAQLGRMRALVLGTATVVPALYFSAKSMEWIGKKAGGILASSFDNTEEALFMSTLWLPSQIGFPMLINWGENFTYWYLLLKREAFSLQQSIPIVNRIPLTMQNHEEDLLKRLASKRKLLNFVPGMRDIARYYTRRDAEMKALMSYSTKPTLTPQQQAIEQKLEEEQPKSPWQPRRRSP